LKDGEEERAIGLLQQAVKSAPSAFEPRYLLGSAYNRLGRYREALAELQGAVRLGADESEVYYHLARAYGGLGRQDERTKALAQFAELTRKSKEDTEAQRRALRLMDEARSLVDAGNLRMAAARMEEARQQRPSDDRLLFRLASLHYDLQRYDLARSYAQEAISLAPSEWLYHYLLGLIEKGSGKWPQARSSLETAARLNGSAAEVQNALGEVALREGDRQRAIAAFQRAAELDPKEQAYKLNLDAARAK
jgi:tetratricopeptide (TPR) repeat protein